MNQCFMYMDTDEFVIIIHWIWEVLDRIFMNSQSFIILILILKFLTDTPFGLTENASNSHKFFQFELGQEGYLHKIQN